LSLGTGPNGTFPSPSHRHSVDLYSPYSPYSTRPGSPDPLAGDFGLLDPSCRSDFSTSMEVMTHGPPMSGSVMFSSSSH
jgi:hypothetical protein